MIHPEVLRNGEAYARRFASAQPFHYVEFDDFLEAVTCQRLLDEFPRFEQRYAMNEWGEPGGKAVRMDVRSVSETYRDLDRYLQTRECLDFVSSITGIPDLLYDPDYIGGGTHDNRDGQDLAPHIDFNYHPRSKLHRRLNLILYFNHGWQESWGGSLEFHSNPWDLRANTTQRVLPGFNRAVIFETTERSWHGFRRIDLPVECKTQSRKSFAVYFYTRERPKPETVPPHASIYVPEELPRSVTTGKVLDAHDVADLTARFTRLRTQLRYIYQREQQFNAQIAGLEHVLAETRAGLRLPLQGYATQRDAPQGMWPDEWVGDDFAGRFVLQKKITVIEMDVWVSGQLDGDQTLDIEMCGRRWQQQFAREEVTKIRLFAPAPAGAEVSMRIRAAKHFVPAQAGQSGDDRVLAWQLLGITLTH